MKELERTDQVQSLKISKLFGNSRNASISIIDNEKEIYKAYSTGDLIDILFISPESCNLTLSPSVGMWTVKYTRNCRGRICTRETKNASLIQGLCNMIASVYTRGTRYAERK